MQLSFNDLDDGAMERKIKWAGGPHLATDSDRPFQYIHGFFN